MGYHKNTLLYSDEGNIKASNTDHTKKFSLVNLDKISLVTPGEKFVCHAQVIMNIRDQGRKLGLDISRFSTDYDSNIIGHHRNTLPPDEGNNKVSNPDIDTASKPNIDITQ